MLPFHHYRDIGAEPACAPFTPFSPSQLGEKPVVDEEVMEACLKEITKALLSVREHPPLPRPSPVLPPAFSAAAAQDLRRALTLPPPPARPPTHAQSDVNVGLVVQMKKARSPLPSSSFFLPPTQITLTPQSFPSHPTLHPAVVKPYTCSPSPTEHR